jgi:hypothetical protein
MSDVSVIGLGAMGWRALPAGFWCGPARVRLRSSRYGALGLESGADYLDGAILAYPDQMGFRTPSAPRVQDKLASP